MNKAGEDYNVTMKWILGFLINNRKVSSNLELSPLGIFGQNLKNYKILHNKRFRKLQIGKLLLIHWWFCISNFAYEFYRDCSFFIFSQRFRLKFEMLQTNSLRIKKVCLSDIMKFWHSSFFLIKSRKFWTFTKQWMFLTWISIKNSLKINLISIALAS